MNPCHKLYTVPIVTTAVPAPRIKLQAGVEAARNRYTDFFGPGCDCFAF